MKQITVPFYVKVMGWLISLTAFALGFWHTHDGLRAMKPLGTEYGSFLVAGLISMVLVVAYSRAIKGVKIAFLFYILCAIFTFTFNLNSFYPTKLSRKLLKEETISLNDTLQNYASKLDFEQSGLGVLDLQTLNDIQGFKTTVLREIIARNGFGPIATDALNSFNVRATSNISPDRDLGVNDIERKKKYDFYVSEMDKAINNYVIKKLSNGDKIGISIIENNSKMQNLKNLYKDSLSLIISDNSSLKVDDSTRFHPQIRTLISMVNQMDEIVTSVNKTTGKNILANLNKDNATNSIPKSQFIGEFDHTLASVGSRINRLDTWGVLFLVLFIDLIVPLAMYFLIRDKNGQTSDVLSKFKTKPTTF